MAELTRKLGLKPGQHVAFVGAPPAYADVLGPLPDGVVLTSALDGPLDLIQAFATTRADLEAELPRLKAALAKNGMLWLSWPKKAARMPTDLDREQVRALGLAVGLVDVKVCAVDDTWSALKFVYHLDDR